MSFSCEDSLTRDYLDDLAACLAGNQRLRELRIVCFEREYGGWYTLSFDQRRQCTINCFNGEMLGEAYNLLFDWLFETPNIVFSQLILQLSNQQTLDYIRQRILGRFHRLHVMNVNVEWPIFVTPNAKAHFLSALQQNKSLLWISLHSFDPDVETVARFLSRRNRVIKLMSDTSPERNALWPPLLSQLVRESTLSAAFLALREGLGHFWLPDE